jgi:hypothetical protein
MQRKRFLLCYVIASTVYGSLALCAQQSLEVFPHSFMSRLLKHILHTSHGASFEFFELKLIFKQQWREKGSIEQLW